MSRIITRNEILK